MNGIDHNADKGAESQITRGVKENADEQLRISSSVFVGSPLMDTTAEVDDDFLHKYRIQMDNAYTINEEMRAVFSDIKQFPCSIEMGGSVTNTCRVFRKLAPTGHLVTFVGAVGSDADGFLIKSTLTAEKIDACLAEIPTKSTGKVAVLLKEKHRTLITDLGASRFFALHHLEEHRIWRKSSQAQLLYTSAFFIGVSFEVLCRIIEEKLPETVLAINLGAPFLSAKYRKELIYLYKHANLIFGNEAEHRAFAETNAIPGDDLAAVLQEMQRFYKNGRGVVVVTRGDRAVLLLEGGKVSEFDVDDSLTVVDTNGAGDAFVGGFLAGYVAGYPADICVKIGIGIAGKAIQNVGLNFLIETLESVDRK